MNKITIALTTLTTTIAVAIIGGIIVNQAKSALILPLSKIAPLSAELEVKSETGTISWQEYKQIITTYNAKLDEIKKNCDLDKRCKNGDVNFGDVKDKKDLVRTINNWLKTDNSIYGK